MGMGEANAAGKNIAADDEESPNSSGEKCSICLELVLGDGRSPVKLICGHEFHLDCIGSAFNSRGAMQCPNCRNTEKGRWLYASVLPGMNDSHDEDVYFEYTDAPLGAPWYQIMLSQLSPSSDSSSVSSDGETPSTVYQAFLSALASDSTALELPHLSYHGPSPLDNLYNNHWSTSLSGLNEAQPTSFTFPSANPRFASWEHRAPPHLQAPTNSRLGNAENLSASQMLARFHSNLATTGFDVHPFAAAHSSDRRASNIIPPSQPYVSTRAGDAHLFAMQAAYERQMMRSRPPQGRRSPLSPAGRGRPGGAHQSSSRPQNRRSDLIRGHYVFPPNAPNGYFQEADRSLAAWETVHLPPSSPNNGERENGWGPPSQGR